MALMGWAIARGGMPAIEVAVDGRILIRDLRPTQCREDIDIAFHSSLVPGTPTGWATTLDLSGISEGEHSITGQASHGGDVLPLGVRTISIPKPADMKAWMETVAPLLSSPDDGSPMRFDGHAVQSLRTGRRYPLRNGQIFLSATGESWTVRPTSVWGISHYSRRLLEQSTGIVLILGAGLADVYPNSVQLDIFDYPNVDIVTGGGPLPFLDGSLGGVICENVIEHVPEPWALVREIERVLQPGAPLVLIGTSMYFTHGFPSHYFNPTNYGLEYLIEKMCRFEGAYEHVNVSRSLHAILSFYFSALPPDAREVVGRLTIPDLLRYFSGEVADPAIIRSLEALPPHAAKALSINSIFVGTKKRT